MVVVLFMPVEIEVENWEDAHGVARDMSAITETPLGEDLRVKSWKNDDTYVIEGDLLALRKRLGMM